jgi:hypothetical protein
MTAVFPVMLAVWPSIAHPETQPAPASVLRFADKPLTINLVLGLGTPTGEIGGTAEYSFVDSFAAGVGVGTNPWGTQLAVSGRFRLKKYEGPRVAHAFDFVAAFAMGQYSDLMIGDLSGNLMERAYWVQVDLDYEFLRSGFHFATGIGLAFLAGTSNVRRMCGDYCPPDPPDVFPTMHLTLGFGI